MYHFLIWKMIYKTSKIVYLHGYRKIVLSFSRKSNLDRLFRKGLITRCRSSNFNDMHLLKNHYAFRISIIKFKIHTFPAVADLTAKQNRFDGSGFVSNLNCKKQAAWPSIGWLTFLSTLYNCIFPATRFSWISVVGIN